MDRAKEIIIVDDQHDILDIVSESIRGYDKDANIYLFDNTESALEEVSYSGENIDLIITDYNVPDLNGDGFARKAKEYTNCPIILFSGNTLVTKGSCYSDLFTKKIVKGNLSELLAIVKDLLE